MHLPAAAAAATCNLQRNRISDIGSLDVFRRLRKNKCPREIRADAV